MIDQLGALVFLLKLEIALPSALFLWLVQRLSADARLKRSSPFVIAFTMGPILSDLFFFNPVQGTISSLVGYLLALQAPDERTLHRILLLYPVHLALVPIAVLHIASIGGMHPRVSALILSLLTAAVHVVAFVWLSVLASN